MKCFRKQEKTTTAQVTLSEANVITLLESKQDKQLYTHMYIYMYI